MILEAKNGLCAWIGPGRLDAPVCCISLQYFPWEHASAVIGETMTAVYRSSDFSLTQAAIDHMDFLRGEYQSWFSDDSPVLAGIFSSHSLTENGMGPRQLGVGFWRQSEVSPQAWAEEKIVEIAGFKVLLALPQIDLLLLHGGEIDYSAKEGLFLRTSEY